MPQIDTISSNGTPPLSTADEPKEEHLPGPKSRPLSPYTMWASSNLPSNFLVSSPMTLHSLCKACWIITTFILLSVISYFCKNSFTPMIFSSCLRFNICNPIGVALSSLLWFLGGSVNIHWNEHPGMRTWSLLHHHHLPSEIPRNCFPIQPDKVRNANYNYYIIVRFMLYLYCGSYWTHNFDRTMRQQLLEDQHGHSNMKRIISGNLNFLQCHLFLYNLFG